MMTFHSKKNHAMNQQHKIEIRLDMVPPTTTHQQKKIVKCGRFSRLADTPKLKQAIADYMAHLEPFRPDEPLAGAVTATYIFIFPHPANTPKYKQLMTLPKTTKPDADNLTKTLQDVLTKLGFITDDAIIADTRTIKLVGPKPAILINLKQWD